MYLACPRADPVNRLALLACAGAPAGAKGRASKERQSEEEREMIFDEAEAKTAAKNTMHELIHGQGASGGKAAREKGSTQQHHAV